MKSSHKENGTDTILGDLIATISDVAFEYAADTEEAYENRSSGVGEDFEKRVAQRENRQSARN